MTIVPAGSTPANARVKPAAQIRKTKNRSALIHPVTRRSGPTNLDQADRPDRVNRRTRSETDEAPGHRTAKGPACIRHNGEAAPGKLLLGAVIPTRDKTRYMQERETVRRDRGPQGVRLPAEGGPLCLNEDTKLNAKHNGTQK